MDFFLLRVVTSAFLHFLCKAVHIYIHIYIYCLKKKKTIIHELVTGKYQICCENIIYWPMHRTAKLSYVEKSNSLLHSPKFTSLSLSRLFLCRIHERLQPSKSGL